VTIRRFFVTVDGRTVHGRRAGHGPPLVLLHQSPRSSAELEPLIALLAARWDVIAPDTPGNGLSEPIGEGVIPLARFADATARLLDTLGIGRCVVYGFHTGAAIACALAVQHAGRISAALLNGLPVFESHERDDLAAHYLPAFEPRWDGSHLAWAWARLREQTIFFPWYRGNAASRMAFDVPDPETLTHNVVELCRAGGAYRSPYGAAFADSGAALARQLAVPTRIVATGRDPLAPHLHRLVDLPPCVSVGPIAPGLQPVVEALEAFRPTNDSSTARANGAPTPAHIGYAGAAGEQCCWHRRGQAAPCDLVFHDLGESGRLALDKFTGDALAFDWPGHGASDACQADDAPGYIERAVAELQIETRRVIAHGQITDLARLALPGCIVEAASPPWTSMRWKHESDAFRTPDFAGGHLAMLWHRARDRALFDPWYTRVSSAAIETADAPTPAAVQQSFLASLIAAPVVRERLAVDQ